MNRRMFQGKSEVLREGYLKGLRKAQRLLREQLESMVDVGFISEDEMTAIVKDGTKEAGLYEVMQYEDRILGELGVDFEASPIVFLGDERQEVFRTTKLLDAIIYAKGMMEYTDDFKIQEIEF